MQEFKLNSVTDGFPAFAWIAELYPIIDSSVKDSWLATASSVLFPVIVELWALKSV